MTRAYYIAAAIVAGVLLAAGAGFAGGWKAKPATRVRPAPPRAAPPFQQVTYAGTGLIQTLNYQGVLVADLTFGAVKRTAYGYRTGWYVTEADGTIGHWIVKTDRHGRIESISLERRRTPGSS